MKRAGVVAMAILLAAAAGFAAERGKPDFSKERLILMFRDEPDEQSALSVEPHEVRYTKGDWMFRFLPILAPILVNDGAVGLTPAPIVDPFFVTRTVFPYRDDDVPTADLAERWTHEERRYRRRLLAAVRVANARENRK